MARHPLLSRHSILTGCFLAAQCACSSVDAQCTGRWLPGQGVAGVEGNNANVYATIQWDPDGPGPMQPQMVIAGNFDKAGRTRANGVVTWDTGHTWAPLSNGLSSTTIRALAVTPAGNLFAGGDFHLSTGIGANIYHFAQWNGDTWIPVGPNNSPSDILKMVAMPDGTIIASGTFPKPGSSVPDSMARWDGAQWQPIAAAPPPQSVSSLLARPDGSLIVVGGFSVAQGIANIAVWNGTAWSPIGGGTNGVIKNVVSLPNGDLLICGAFTTAGGSPASRIAKWNGQAWSAFPSSPTGISTGTVDRVLVRANGQVIAAGAFTCTGGAKTVAAWNGAAWTTLGSLPTLSTSFFFDLIELPNGDLLTSGISSSTLPLASAGLARWNGTAWVPPDGGSNGTVMALKQVAGGDIVAGGDFTWLEGTAASAVARWNGQTWSTPTLPISGTVSCLLVQPNDGLWLGGTFSYQGTNRNIAVWNGGAISLRGSVDTVYALAVGPTGPYIFTSSGFLRLSGGFWTFLPSAGISWAAITSASGELIASATGLAPTHLGRWNGSAWTTFGVDSPSTYPLDALLEMPNLDLIAGGVFTSIGTVAANRIARWNGAAWSTLGSGFNDRVNTLSLLPNGDILAGGYFTASGSTPINHLARWDGNQWLAYGQGLDDAVVSSLVLPSGEIIVGGSFLTAGGEVSAHVARWVPTCPADFDCSGSITVRDIFAFLSAWFSASPTADFDHINGITVTDIFAFLSAWFSGC